jgi:site-specific DNA recombinase
MNGIVYCRVSSKEQAEGTSLEFQEEACRDYARIHHITLLKVFVERGESAKFAERTQLLELIDFCRTHKGAVQVLIVWKIDRFARNVSDHFSVKATLLKYGVRIVSVTEPIEQNPEGKLMETILAGFAQFDNDIRALRTVQGMRRKIEEGIFPWKPPLGYRSAIGRKGEKKTEPDIPDEPLFGLLQKAWREFATGAYTKTQILRLMGVWGVTTRKGALLTAQSLDHLFRNPYYAGVLADPWSGAEHEGRHLPIVTRAEFARVQEIIRGRNHSKPHVREREEFPLRGCVQCPACRRPMTSGFSRGRFRRYPYYNCGNRTCGNHTSYRAAVIHDEFETFLDRIAPKREALAKLGAYVLREIEERQKTEKANATRRESDLRRFQRQIQELIQMRAEKLISTDEFLEQKALLARQMSALEVPLALAKAQSGLKEKIAGITAPLTALPETWQALPLQLRPRFKQLVLPVGFVVGRIRTAQKGRLFCLNDDFGEGESHEVPLTSASSNQILQEIQAFADLFRSVQALKPAVGDQVQSISAKVTSPDAFEPTL